MVILGKEKEKEGSTLVKKVTDLLESERFNNAIKEAEDFGDLVVNVIKAFFFKKK